MMGGDTLKDLIDDDFHNPLPNGEEGKETDEPDEEEDEFKYDIHVENDIVPPDEV